MAKFSDPILSRDELQELVQRNNRSPHSDRVPDKAWTNNKRCCETQSQLDEYLRRMNVQPQVDHAGWLKQLHSKTWRVQSHGQKEARVVTKPVRTQHGWFERPLNARG